MSQKSLQSAIERSLKARHGEVTIRFRLLRVREEAVAVSAYTNGASIMVNGNNQLDGLQKLAAHAGLREDGNDPLAELERVTRERDEMMRELDEARSALRAYAPRNIENSPHAEALRKATHAFGV